MTEPAKPPSVGAYLRTFSGRVLALMSGSLSVPFALAALYLPNEWLRALFALLAILAVFGSSYILWRDERKRVNELKSQVARLEERLKPRLAFLMRGDCCIRPALLAVGVGNPSATSVNDACVYIDIPKLGIQNVPLAWMSLGASQRIDIHPGVLPRDHHHSEWIVTAGDQAGQFFLHLALHDPRLIDPGEYDAEISVRGRDAISATARVQFTCRHPRSLSARLM